MITLVILVVIWVVYTVALGKFLFHICDLPPAPIFDFDSIGVCAGFVLALAGWIFYSAIVLAYINQCW